MSITILNKRRPEPTICRNRPEYRLWRSCLLCLSLTLVSAISLAATPTWGYRIKQQTSHNSNSFTQGLEIYQGKLIESSGLYGKSFVMLYPPGAESPERLTPLPSKLFAEGVAVLNHRLYLLTWESGVLLEYALPGLQLKQEHRYRGEGWGLTTMGKRLVMSNGSSQLLIRRAGDFAIVGKINVREEGKPIVNLNELAYDGQYLWANVWKSTRILAIDPHSGEVVGQVELQSLAQREPNLSPENVLNGLAWDKERQGLWVTGKRWSQLYLLEIHQR